jgi:hypothetical protein
MSVSTHVANMKGKRNAISSETHEIFICVYTNQKGRKKPAAERKFAAVMKTYQIER